MTHFYLQPCSLWQFSDCGSVKSNPKVSTIFWQFQKEAVDYPGGGDWGSNTTFELYVQLFKDEV